MPDLFPYQVEGRDFLLRNQAAMLADQPGLGKTGQALSALKELNNNLNVCVIAPKTALTNWQREWSKWGVTHKHKRLITNYERLIYPDHPDAVEFQATNWDVVIVDEAHRLKNVGAKRTQIIYRKICRAGYVWLLTGTPARNHAGELWTHIRALRPDLIPTAGNTPMTLDQFEAKYCRIKFDRLGNRQVAGSKNIGELRKLLEDSGFFLRRRKQEVLKDLPDLIFDTYILPPVQLDDETNKLIRKAHRYIANMNGDDDVMDFLENPPDNFPLSSLMRTIGIAKAGNVADFVTEELEAPEKIIVFYKHTDVGDILADRLSPFKPARVDGKTKDAQAEVDMFQDDPDCRVFLGQISACQEALNLTAATQCVFAEASWSPADNEQAACRGHRIGMQPGYVVRFAVLNGTIDETLMAVLKRKTDELYQLFG